MRGQRLRIPHGQGSKCSQQAGNPDQAPAQGSLFLADAKIGAFAPETDDIKTKQQGNQACEPCYGQNYGLNVLDLHQWKTPGLL